MKNLALTLVLALITACSSGGTTVSDPPINLTGTYEGVFENQDGRDEGTVSLNLVESANGAFSGIATIDGSGCLVSGQITGGTRAGFTLQLIISQQPGGSLILQLTSDNMGTLEGTYTISGTGTACSANSGTGTVSISL